jgi:hypothetical protein
VFAQYFEIRRAIVAVSPEALKFKGRFPLKWGKLIKLGYTESDLSVKSLTVILTKKTRAS